MIQYTPGQTFYYQLSDAIDAQDFATLETLYHPDAVSLSMSTGQVFRGRKAILDSFKRAFQIGGAISSRAVESLVEAGGAVCVEAQLSTRIAQMQTYDIYLLQAGMVKQHVGGLISPRPPIGRKSVQGWSQAKGAALYQQYWQALAARDFSTLANLYHPDAISVACSTNQFYRGRAAIIGLLKEGTANGGYVKLNSVESFVESGEIICVEITQTARRVSELGPVQIDALMYDVFVLHAGRILQHFGGAIAPRGPEIQQAAQEQMKRLIEAARDRGGKLWDATHPRRYPWG
ncbi:MAG TPA: nuclear transport factor 2 family protein [Ktedonobacteraceae bacterium]|nr:nuclear transport factor 2 family protein [Ktedonobacteraceae bacterium]